ncbi:MAG: transporter associated domain-containing protein [Bacteroidota bacterium]|nr:transporter associated domain-containing protein [Bacteroidota bacterium]
MEPASHITEQISVFPGIIFAEVSPLIIPLILIVLLILIAVVLLHPLNTTILTLLKTLIHRKIKGKMGLTPSDLVDTINDLVVTDTTVEEQQLMKGVARFSDIEVKDIMRSRMDITAVEINQSFDNLIQTVISSGYSRIPIYDGTIDQVRGIVYAKDLLPYIRSFEEKEWQRLIRKAWFIPENMQISDLLHEFQEKKTHIAIIVDEFGGTAGLVTMEDVLEEIVGEIKDEYDTDTEDMIYHKLGEYDYLFEAKATLNDFCKITGVDDDTFDNLPGDPDTLAGLILELAGRIPEAGYEVKFHNLHFTVESVDKRRIRRIRIILPDLTINEE